MSNKFSPILNMATVNTESESLGSKAISALSLRSRRPIDLKKEQDLAIKSLLGEKDVMAVLPTGFGKSLVFQVFAIIKIDRFGFIEWLCLGNFSPQEYHKRSD